MNTVPAKVLNQALNYGDDYSYTWSYGESLTGATVSFVGINVTDVTTTGAVLATSNGTGADVAQTVALDTGSLATGGYYLEVYKNKGATSELLLYPPENVSYVFYVQERRGR